MTYLHKYSKLTGDVQWYARNSIQPDSECICIDVYKITDEIADLETDVELYSDVCEMIVSQTRPAKLVGLACQLIRGDAVVSLLRDYRAVVCDADPSDEYEILCVTVQGDRIMAHIQDELVHVCHV